MVTLARCFKNICLIKFGSIDRPSYSKRHLLLMLAVVALLLLKLLCDGREQILVGLGDLVVALSLLLIRLLLHGSW